MESALFFGAWTFCCRSISRFTPTTVDHPSWCISGTWRFRQIFGHHIYIHHIAASHLSMLRRFAFIPLFMLGQRSPESCSLWGSDAPQMHIAGLKVYSWDGGWMGDIPLPNSLITVGLFIFCRSNAQFLAIMLHLHILWLSMATSMTGIAAPSQESDGVNWFNWYQRKCPYNLHMVELYQSI